ncbi:hypothetical protein NE551_17270, partial [Erysipelatoclostridium ramosum]|nr:hypothetical protein [Thomasclavelia ramosa]
KYIFDVYESAIKDESKESYEDYFGYGVSPYLFSMLEYYYGGLIEMENCIFWKFAYKEIPGKIVYEDDL